MCSSEGLWGEFTYLRKGCFAVPFVLFCGKMKFMELRLMKLRLLNKT